MRSRVSYSEAIMIALIALCIGMIVGAKTVSAEPFDCGENVKCSSEWIDPATEVIISPKEAARMKAVADAKTRQRAAVAAMASTDPSSEIVTERGWSRLVPAIDHPELIEYPEPKPEMKRVLQGPQMGYRGPRKERTFYAASHISTYKYLPNQKVRE